MDAREERRTEVSVNGIQMNNLSIYSSQMTLIHWENNHDILWENVEIIKEGKKVRLR